LNKTDMLNKSKQTKLFNSLKKYSKQYLSKKLVELDESGTRLMINSFLTDVLGFTPIDEVKTEYMIRGTYADYVIQIKGNRKFLVEVKSLSLNLSDKHLRQAINYGANEGIDWALLTNGKHFDFYKIIFGKPIDYRKVFSIDLSDTKNLKSSVDFLQHLHKDGIANKGLEMLWNKCIALDPANVAGFLYSSTVTNYLKKSLKLKYKHKFSDEEIKTAINKIIYQAIGLENVKPKKTKKVKSRTKTQIVAPISTIAQ
ncbi:MAG: hypothetical protein A3K10_14780, partial [Bacteroidetes bacterium RIFCSPLOWO2_12_FULL_31_6]